MGAFYFNQEGGGNCSSVIAIPTHNPVIVPRGGSFTFDITLINNCDTSFTTDVWGAVIYSNGGSYGPTFLVNNYPLAPNAVITYSGAIQNVPDYAPYGDYTYIVYTGDYDSGEIDDSSSFSFTVYSDRGVPMGINEWQAKLDFGVGTSQALVGDYELAENYPNPFNAQTTISYSLPEAENISLEIYNLAGQKVATLVDGYEQAGEHRAVWDASNYSSGIYFYKLTAADKIFTKRMTLLK